MHINYPFEKGAYYLVACSYGPDSMALLHSLMQQLQKIVVCHVNYHKRDISNFEEESLKKFCEESDLKFEKIDAPKKAEGNFQSWARELRYDFFAEIYQKYDAKGLFVAHQQDDLIETYLIQKQRRSRVKHYGIEPISHMKNMIIVRPFLAYSKQDLLEYCHENHVPFSIDASNFENRYLRNRIRHEVVDKLTEIERYQILKEIEEKNALLLEKNQVIRTQFEGCRELSIPDLLRLSPDEFNSAIIQFVAQTNKHIALSEKQLQEIRKICMANTPNIDIPLKIGLRLLKEYDALVISDVLRAEPYSFTLEKPGALTTEFFEVDFSDGAEERNIKTEDYPLTIRTFAPKDCYRVGDYETEVRRLYIDWKMPMRIRLSWPVVVNKDGIIIYIPRYRKKFAETNKSKFIIKVV